MSPQASSGSIQTIALNPKFFPRLPQSTRPIRESRRGLLRALRASAVRLRYLGSISPNAADHTIAPSDAPWLSPSPRLRPQLTGGRVGTVHVPTVPQRTRTSGGKSRAASVAPRWTGRRILRTWVTSVEGFYLDADNTDGLRLPDRLACRSLSHSALGDRADAAAGVSFSRECISTRSLTTRDSPG